MKYSLIVASAFALLGIFASEAQAKENGLTAKQIQNCREKCVTAGGVDLEASNLDNNCVCKGVDGDTVNVADANPRAF